MKRIFTPGNLILLLPILIGIMFSNSVKAQNEQLKHWYFGQNAGIDFNNGFTVPLSNGAMNHEYGTSSISDRNTGALLFYTDGDSVWDASHNLMTNGSGLGAGDQNFQSCIIVPFPQSDSLYYIFSTGSINNNYELEYAVVDMSLNGGLGAVTLKNQALYGSVLPVISATHHSNGQDFWLLTHKMNSDSFYVHPITSAGIGVPVINQIGWASSVVPWGHSLKFAPNGEHLAWSHDFHAFSVFDFDPATGAISDEVTTTPTFTSGVSFSPNSRYVYTLADEIWQYDLISNDSSMIVASGQAIANPSPNMAALQLSVTGQIFMAEPNNASLGIIDAPNAAGVAANFIPSSFILQNGAVSQFGLPNMIESYGGICSVEAGADVLACQGGAQLSATPATPGNYTWNWSPSIANLSDPTIPNPIATQVDSVMFTVIMTDNNGCYAYDSVLVAAYNAVIDTFLICDSTYLDLGPGFSQYDWFNFQDTTGTFYNWSGVNTQAIWAQEPGTYYAMAVQPACGALTSQITVLPDPACALPPCGVDAGPDVLACGTTAQLMATPNTPGVYSYTWTPTTGLDDPNIANPTASQVDSVMYYVTIADQATSCVAVDSVLVASYAPVIDSLLICDSLLLDLGPGFDQYDWQGYTDTAGNWISWAGVNTQTAWAYEPGEYLALSAVSPCGWMTSLIVVETDPLCDSSSVYPGDCNNDGIANNLDYLYLGLAYGNTGSARSTSSIQWQAWPAVGWPMNFPTSGINHKYADCNGNGLVSTPDTTAILQNYNLTHAAAPVILDSALITDPDLYFTFSDDSVMAGDTLLVDIYLGTNNKQVTNFYGMAFTLSYDTALVDPGGVTLTFDQTSWLGVDGVDALNMTYDDWNLASIDAAYTRIDHQGVDGFGHIGVMQVVMQDDISGKKAALITEQFNLEATDIVCFTPDENVIGVNGYVDSALVFMNDVGLVDAKPVLPLQAWPVPARDQLYVSGITSKVQSLHVFAADGREVTVSWSANAKGRAEIDVSELASGVYHLEVYSAGAPQRKQFVVR